MGFIDNVIAAVSPKKAYEREAWRQGLEAIRGYDAAGFGRINAGWRAHNESAEITDRHSRDVVRARARDLERNSDILQAVILAYKRNVVGKALARQQELVTLARNEGRDLTAEEQAEFNRCQTVIDAAGNEGGEAVGQPAGGERGAENGGQGAPAGTTQGGVSDSQRAVAEERQRTADIMALCRQTGMDPAEYIRSGASMDDVRAAAVDFLIQNNGPVGTRMSDNSREQDNFRQAATDALLMRSGIDVERPTESAEQMRGLSLRDLAIECTGTACR